MKLHLSSPRPSLGKGAGALARVPLDSLLRSLAAGVVAGLSMHAPSTHAAGNATFQVTNCDDAGPGSLRQALIDDHWLIDVSACAQISLVTGELTTAHDTVFIGGNGTLITASGASRILSHSGGGSLLLQGLDLAEGAVSDVRAQGGCVASQGDVLLRDASVRDCTVSGIPDPVNVASAVGGGVYARGNVWLDRVVVQGNAAIGAADMYSSAEGGGIFAGGNLTMTHSSITGNTVVGASSFSNGGGAIARGMAYVAYSTIDANTAPHAGGLQFGNDTSASTIINSTISGNSGAGASSADMSLRVWNSTIAFNHGGIQSFGNNSYLSLHGSILANNDRDGAADDVAAIFPVTVAGSNNIVLMSSLALPSDTIAADPRLAPLGDNGGAVRTHALRSGSPAIDHGDNVALKTYDARAEPFDRVVGPAADIGAYEVQPNELDVLFDDGFDVSIQLVKSQRRR